MAAAALGEGAAAGKTDKLISGLKGAAAEVVGAAAGGLFAQGEGVAYRVGAGGLGMGAGFTFALLCLGAVREILGAGALFGLPLFGENFQPWVVMILPPGGFFVLGGWLLIFAWFRQRRERSSLAEEGATVHGS